ncbi:MAG: hypothetical protein A2840_01415 [Candidatus Buchananbacteria bacterium RIFCSPHIGHO2_01_FULL_47_11b]|uniref:Uncharacterized protein n=1 Tax=Candidatus Buchananbacteria bacterium RIFCSPHIGHO2_01_FULL_47_11b TaxID=1797537 RepID=A0A1G1Y2M1_9BACT|nr:MAG: hypothetical protein A2840_01415 [Candidatus Buchananbacteria bacterium RIFCSPHIGHO2_01_FULL_47_11b]
MKKSLLIALGIGILIGIPLMAIADVSLPNPISGDLNDKDLIEVLVRSLQLVLGAVDIFALFMFVLGGFELLMSGGNPTLVKKGKDTLIWATLGILVITLSYSILKFIYEAITKVGGA